MSEITVAARKFVRLFDYLDRIGANVDAVASRAGLARSKLAHLEPDQNLPARLYSALYRESVLEMQSLNHPLPWGAGVGSEAFELMCHCMIGARNLRDALHLAQRFDHLVVPMTQYNMRLIEEGDTARLSYRIRLAEQDSPLVPEDWDRADYQETAARASGLMVWHALCGWLVGQPLATTEVNVAAPYLNEAYGESMYRVFGCPVNFGTEENTFVFASEELDRRLVHTIDSLNTFLQNSIYELIAIDRRQASTSSAIKSLITIELPSGLPSFTQISEHLHMSESSLRRRLQRENTSYQNLKDEVRCHVAVDKLINENAKVADLAEYLGFTEPSSFVRSFKGWTGETPNTYREKMRVLGGAP